MLAASTLRLDLPFPFCYVSSSNCLSFWGYSSNLKIRASEPRLHTIGNADTCSYSFSFRLNHLFKVFDWPYHAQYKVNQSRIVKVHRPGCVEPDISKFHHLKDTVYLTKWVGRRWRSGYHTWIIYILPPRKIEGYEK